MFFCWDSAPLFVKDGSGKASTFTDCQRDSPTALLIRKVSGADDRWLNFCEDRCRHSEHICELIHPQSGPRLLADLTTRQPVPCAIWGVRSSLKKYTFTIILRHARPTKHYRVLRV